MPTNMGLEEIYLLDTTFSKIYTTTELIVSHAGWDRALWWPTKNFLLFRQYDKKTWDGYGLNIDSASVVANSANYPPEKQFEPFSTGPIQIDGDLPLDAVYASDFLTLYRKNTMDGNSYVSMYSWTPGHFKKEYENSVTSVNEMTSLVSFGLDGALAWHKTETTGVLYKTDGTTASITVEITNPTFATTWGGLSSYDLRLLQARPSPDNDQQNPPVYAYFTAYDLFTVTLDIANTKIILDPVVTLSNRFNLYQPVDIGHFHIANMVIHPCTLPTTDTDIYDNGSVLFYEFGTDGLTPGCIDIANSDLTFK